MAKDTIKEFGRVSSELSQWFKDQSQKTGIPRTSLIAMAMQEYRIKKEKEENE